MATTTNFGWTTPDNTDLVKDGAAAIRTLGSSIDTSFVDFKGGTTGQVLKKTSNTDLDVEWGSFTSGLVLINTTSFTAVSAVNLTANIFSATYDNYIVLVNTTFGAASGTLQARMRLSGTDNTSNEYIRQFMRGTSTSVATNTDTGTFFNIGDLTNTYRNIFKIELNQPAAAVVTTGHVIGSRSGYVNLTTLTHNVATAYDSMTIYPDTSTITGKIQVFGYSL